ncbi:MAG: hypothetical protein ACLQK4_12075 [Acidimicrobiales bacterium]|jgi:hypothetical protein
MMNQPIEYKVAEYPLGQPEALLEVLTANSRLGWEFANLLAAEDDRIGRVLLMSWAPS